MVVIPMMRELHFTLGSPGNALQGGKDSQDALSLLVIFRKRALYLMALLRKMRSDLTQICMISRICPQNGQLRLEC